MDTGSNNAEIGASDDVPGPHVPPAAGTGREMNTPDTAKATPNRPISAKITLTQA
jgi:hypothetical protein